MRNSVLSLLNKKIYISQIPSVLDMSMVSLYTMNLCQGGRLPEIFDFAHT